MALQTVITGSNGMDISYWRITDGSFAYDGAEADNMGFRFNLAGYKDADWRAKGAVAQTYQMQMIVPNGASSVSGLGPTGGAPIPANILTHTSGELRPALYAWLKTQTAWNSGGQNPAVTVDWSAATDV